MIPVILSGGSGTRLWPLSREQYPKQFLPLVSKYTMLQETLLRLDGIKDLDAPIIVCNETHRFIVAEQFQQIGRKPAAIILEPAPKNTAPALTIAALSAKPDEMLLVLPADHIIRNLPNFYRAITHAKQLVEQNFLVTFGIIPTEPETGYGYIKSSSKKTYRVESFVEKPNLETAKNYVKSGDYFWNSGMFAFKAGVFLQELAKFAPEILETCRQSLEKAKIDLDFTRLDKDAFLQCPSDSVDYAVMEKTDKAVVIPIDVGWNDVGSWSALWAVSKKDENNNATRGDVLLVDTYNSFAYSENKLVTLVGVKDLIVIDSDDALMVTHKDKAQEVKAIVDKLKQSKRAEASVHRKVYRPWGYYDSIDTGDRHKAKRIVVKAGCRLSLQKHFHRAEHWVVVKGSAMVTKGKEKMLITENESIYIPLGVVHCLENPGVIPLEIIEVQSGSYLGEDDIVRLDDIYGRS